MRVRVIAGLALAGLFADASVARAGACVVNGNPVSPQALAYELELGNGFGGLPGQLGGVPYSVVSYESLSIYWSSCAANCQSLQYEGASQCGNLVEAPIDTARALEYYALPDPTAFTEVTAEQSTNGRWDFAANAFSSPEFEHPDGSASYVFALGTREVIDVSGGSGMVPLQIGLRAAGQMEIQQCLGNLFRWIPTHDLRFRVNEQTNFPPFTRNVVDTVYYSQFFVTDVVFEVEVNTPSVVTVDVWFHALANATGANDVFGNQCRGGIAPLDFIGAQGGDGLQVFFSPDPSLTFTPRSGMTYSTVPEPNGALAALAALAMLARRVRRERACRTIVAVRAQHGVQD